MLKQFPYYPVVVFRESGGGNYYHAGLWMPEEVFECEGVDIDTSRGVLVIGNPDNPAAVLAHEARHHWQWTTQHLAEKMAVWPFYTNRPYWEAITEFFSYARHEYDALRFEMTVCPSDVAIDWWIHLEKQGQGFFG